MGMATWTSSSEAFTRHPFERHKPCTSAGKKKAPHCSSCATRWRTGKNPPAKKKSAKEAARRPGERMGHQKLVKPPTRRNSWAWELVITKLVWPRVPVIIKFQTPPADK